jgi:hypothetical protein
MGLGNFVDYMRDTVDLQPLYLFDPQLPLCLDRNFNRPACFERNLLRPNTSHGMHSTNGRDVEAAVEEGDKEEEGEGEKGEREGEKGEGEGEEDQGNVAGEGRDSSRLRAGMCEVFDGAWRYMLIGGAGIDTQKQ